MKRARASAATRIDLAGGTLDIWPVYLLVPGSVTVNLAISRRAIAVVLPRKDGRIVLRSVDTRSEVSAGNREQLARVRGLPLLREAALAAGPFTGFTLQTQSSVPPGSGLGGSSSMAVAVLRALSVAADRPLSRPEILPIARDIEAKVIRVPTGQQDHYGAAYGGLNAIRYGPGELEGERIPIDLKALGRRLVVAIVGKSRLSATTNWRMVRALVDRDREVRRRFDEIARAGREMREALLGQSFAAAAAAMENEYAARRKLVPGVETKAMARVHAAALDAGALAGKVCGAGGGGAMVFLVPPAR